MLKESAAYAADSIIAPQGGIEPALLKASLKQLRSSIPHVNATAARRSGRRSDWQDAADRFDSVGLAVLLDENDHLRGGWSSSAKNSIGLIKLRQQ